mgnify:CR=1 FL=1
MFGQNGLIHTKNKIYKGTKLVKEDYTYIIYMRAYDQLHGIEHSLA